MRDVRATPTGSGTLKLAESYLCMFMTTWGDGRFPITVNTDANGQLLRLTIEFGYDDSELT